MILCKDINWSYGKERILNNINLDFKKGNFYSIIGPNGSGKTTLIKYICKILDIDFKKVFLNDLDIKSYSTKKLAKNISTVPQNTNIEHNFTVYDIVLMGRSPYLKKFQSESEKDLNITDNALKRTNTYHLKDKSIHNISGGERQRVLIARALTQNTELIILDEPVSNIDIHHQIELLDTLKKLNEQNNITIISILHDLNLASEYSDEIILLDNGSIVKIGSSYEVITEENIKKVYQLDVKIIDNPITKKPYVIPIYHQF